MKNKIVLLALCVGLAFTSISTANEQILGDSEQLGLGREPEKRAGTNPKNRAPEKISHLGEEVRVREYNDSGTPMVEVKAEDAPPYYFNKDDLQAPMPEDGVRFRESPQWKVGEW